MNSDRACAAAVGRGVREIRPVYISTARVFFFLALNSLYIESDYVRELRSPPAPVQSAVRPHAPLNATKLPQIITYYYYNIVSFATCYIIHITRDGTLTHCTCIKYITCRYWYKYIMCIYVST